jgi:probable rRNA maturation factor
MINIYGGDSIKNNLIKTVYNATLVAFELPDIFSIDLSFVDEETIRELNYEARDIDEPTDVLSFPYINVKFPIDIIDYPNDIEPDTGKILLGEIMLCYPIIKKQAQEYGHSIGREIAYMTVHGLLHLLGYDHIDEDAKKIMRRKEEEILSSIGYGEDN